MLSRRFGLWCIDASRRYRFGHNRPFCSNCKPTVNNSDKTNVEQGALTHQDSYRDLDKLDFMTAAKILFTTPPKQKKFGLDFHLVQLFFVCMPSLAVYLVAQYARSEMRRMDAELEVRNKGKEAKAKEMEGKAAEAKARSDPQILEVKARLEKLEETVKEFVGGSRQHSATSKIQEVNNKEPAKPFPDNNGRKSEPNKSTEVDLQISRRQREKYGVRVNGGQVRLLMLLRRTKRLEGGNPSQDGKK